MTIEQAFAQLMEGADYAAISKQKDSEGGKYRVMRSRFRSGKLKVLAMVEMLLQYNYVVSVRKAK